VDPLLGKDLIAFEMKEIPPRFISHRFFIDFLKLLDTRALKVGIYGTRKPGAVGLDSRLGLTTFEIKTRVRQLVGNDRYLRNLYKWAVHKLPRRREERYRIGRVTNEILRIYDSSKVVSECFDGASVRKFLAGCPNTWQAYQLLTLMTYMAQVEFRFPEKLFVANNERSCLINKI
jgi:hypothetical protein